MGLKLKRVAGIESCLRISGAGTHNPKYEFKTDSEQSSANEKWKEPRERSEIELEEKRWKSKYCDDQKWRCGTVRFEKRVKEFKWEVRLRNTEP